MTERSNIESEYLDINGRKAWPNLFQSIRAESNLKFDFKCTEAKKTQNKYLNRYRDVNPYDHSRIILKRGTCDYINANLVKVDGANRQYILTQGPLPETVGHFWLMVWEQKSAAILMLNKLVENRLTKCHCYWPEDIGPANIMHFNDVGLKLEYLSMEDHSYYIKRYFKLTDIENDTSREIIQFHYTTWPDFGVPSSPTVFLGFLKTVRDSGALDSNVGPAIVHCSAGIGRSGTFCLVDSCLIMIENGGINSIDVKEVLLDMRKYRMGLIQTPEQLRFSYQAIIEGSKRNPNLNGIEHEKNENNIHIIEPNIYDEVVNNDIDDEDENEPPPLPPPRGDSLNRPQIPAPTLFDRPLPTIPNSASMNEIIYNDSKLSSPGGVIIEHPPEVWQNGPPTRPLPGLPQNDVSSEDERSEGSPSSIHSVDKDEGRLSPSELRHRQRVERNEKITAQVQEIKRKQRSQETSTWAIAKRSLYKPVTLGFCIACIIGGGALVYAYYKG